MIKQERLQLEDSNPSEFFYEVIKKYGFEGIGPYGENRCRSVCKEICTDDKYLHPVDDFIHEMLIQDVLVAFYYERRTSWNFIEATYGVIPEGLKLAKKRLRAALKDSDHPVYGGKRKRNKK